MIGDLYMGRSGDKTYYGVECEPRAGYLGDQRRVWARWRDSEEEAREAAGYLTGNPCYIFRENCELVEGYLGASTMVGCLSSFFQKMDKDYPLP